MVSGWVIGLIVISLILALIALILNGYAISQVGSNDTSAKSYATWSFVLYLFSFIILVGALIAYFYTSRTEITQLVSEKVSMTAQQLAARSKQAQIAQLQAQLAALNNPGVVTTPVTTAVTLPARQVVTTTTPVVTAPTSAYLESMNLQ